MLSGCNAILPIKILANWLVQKELFLLSFLINLQLERMMLLTCSSLWKQNVQMCCHVSTCTTALLDLLSQIYSTSISSFTTQNHIIPFNLSPRWTSVRVTSWSASGKLLSSACEVKSLCIGVINFGVLIF